MIRTHTRNSPLTRPEEAPTGFEPVYAGLQSATYPLGQGALLSLFRMVNPTPRRASSATKQRVIMEHQGIEPC